MREYYNQQNRGRCYKGNMRVPAGVKRSRLGSYNTLILQAWNLTNCEGIIEGKHIRIQKDPGSISTNINFTP
jgi:hypothetical protein